ncbi:MAG: FliM/FliN family flagellar motor switch protein [Parvibaculum sp.]
MAETESMQAGEAAAAEAEIAAAVEAPAERRQAASGNLAEPQSEVKKPAVGIGGSVVDLKRIQSIKVLVQAVLGGISMPVSKLSELKEGEIIPLGTKIGDPIDILTNGQLIARGEIVVIEGPENKFGIQVTSLEPQGNA